MSDDTKVLPQVRAHAAVPAPVSTDVVVDVAGAKMGGAARWVYELDRFVRDTGAATILGRGRSLTGGWMLARERRALGARIVVAANNVAFAMAGRQRRVVLRNVLHFLYPSEEAMLERMPRSLRWQIALVRRLVQRADVIVAPSSMMAQRAADLVPAVADRIAVRPHPVSPLGPRDPDSPPFLLVPVLPAPYKNLVPQLASLLAALDRAGSPVEVRVTAAPADLPAGLSRHPRLVTLGRLPHRELASLWQRATAAFFPSTLEAFGYPLAEARVYGLPVLSPDTAHARELAGPALVGYRSGDLASLTDAVRWLGAPVPAQPHVYSRSAYFEWLFGLPADRRRDHERETHGITS